MTIRERVHGVLGYFDGILSGVADFHGHPHAFELHGDVDDEVLTYRLAPISPETMTQFEKAWGIWLRWEQHPPITCDSTTIPALPHDRSRYAVLKPILDAALKVPADSLLLAKGEFVQRPDADPQRDGRWALDVEWTYVGPDSHHIVGG
jgi:hypothetical protein